MIRSSSVLRGVSAAAATAVLALLVGLSVAVPSHAEDGAPDKLPCVVLCGPDATQTPPPSPGKPTDMPPSSAPVIEPPAAGPVLPAAPAPAPVPTLAPEPSISPAEETPSGAPSTTIPSPSSSSSSATASTESNWNKPITKSAKPTQAAAVSRNDDSGLLAGPGLLAIMGGALLVGVAGLAFAWWSRNRLTSH